MRLSGVQTLTDRESNETTPCPEGPLLYFVLLFVIFYISSYRNLSLVLEKDLDYWNVDPYSLGLKIDKYF